MKQNILQYNGTQYYISIKIFSPTSSVEYDNIKAEEFDVLLWDNVEKMEIENDISNPLLLGELIYKDNSDSVLNKFLNISCKYLNITIKKLLNVNNVSPNEIIDEDITFNHTFIITNIDKIDQKGDSIYYSLKYISTHWWNFNSNINYSTHSNSYNSKESPITILKKLYIQCGLEFDENKISTKTSTMFISDVDENLNTAQLYLLKRMYDRDSLDNPGLIKVVYDYITNIYQLWSLRDHSGDVYVNDVYPKLTSEEVNRNTISVPTYNKYIDGLQNQDPTSLTILNFKPYELPYSKMFDYTYWTYDYITNKFLKKSSTNLEISESLPYLKNDKTRFDKKYYEIENMLSKKEYKGNRIFNRESSQWDENNWPYYDIENIFLNNGLIKVNTAGNLLRKTGDNTFLQIDVTDNSSMLNLKGDWINTRVVHQFGQNYYRNILLLSRVNIAIEDKVGVLYERI